jgi:hypothetical protein
VNNDAPCRDQVIEALVTLTRDENSDVRDWACFGLGQTDADSQAAKDALATRLADSDDDTRCEALLALAKTGDSRAATALQDRLAGDPADLFLLEVRAAGELADPALHPLLLQVSQEWAGHDDEFTPVLAFATRRCRPEARVQAINVERELVARVNMLLTAQGLTVTLVGDYPRSALTFQGVEDPASPAVHDAIWADADPWGYPLEQRARSFVLSYANESADR